MAEEEVDRRRRRSLEEGGGRRRAAEGGGGGKGCGGRGTSGGAGARAASGRLQRWRWGGRGEDGGGEGGGKGGGHRQKSESLVVGDERRPGCQEDRSIARAAEDAAPNLRRGWCDSGGACVGALLACVCASVGEACGLRVEGAQAPAKQRSTHL